MPKSSIYEPFTFGSRYADKIEASIPMEERILNQKLLAFDKTMPRLVDDIDIAPSKNELEEMRKDFIELLSIVGLIIVLALIIGACVYWAMDYKGLI